jgi:drug/metabolite transporter (DMT)-like permease
MVAFAIMNAAAKEAAKTLSFWEVATARAGGGALVAFAFARATGASMRVQNRVILGLRTLTGAAALGSTFYALAHAPLAESVALFNLSPVFIAGLAPWLLQERFEPLVGACLLLALAGLWLVAPPAGLGASLGHVAALAAAVLAALSMISLRKLGRSESAEGVVVWFQGLTAIALIALGYRTFRWPLEREALLLGACAGAGTFGQIAMTRAYAKERAARVGALSYLQIPASVVIGLVVFGEIPAPRALVGIVLILAAGGAVVLVSQRRAA